MEGYSYILKKVRGVKRILTAISPQLETAVNYRFSCGKWIDWRNPNNGDINAKLNWLKVKLYYNNEKVTSCIDKYPKLPEKIITTPLTLLVVPEKPPEICRFLQ